MPKEIIRRTLPRVNYLIIGRHKFRYDNRFWQLHHLWLISELHRLLSILDRAVLYDSLVSEDKRSLSYKNEIFETIFSADSKPLQKKLLLCTHNLLFVFLITYSYHLRFCNWSIKNIMKRKKKSLCYLPYSYQKKIYSLTNIENRMSVK